MTTKTTPSNSASDLLRPVKAEGSATVVAEEARKELVEKLARFHDPDFNDRVRFQQDGVRVEANGFLLEPSTLSLMAKMPEIQALVLEEVNKKKICPVCGWKALEMGIRKRVIVHIRHAHTNYEKELISIPKQERQVRRQGLKSKFNFEASKILDGV